MKRPADPVGAPSEKKARFDSARLDDAAAGQIVSRLVVGDVIVARDEHSDEWRAVVKNVTRHTITLQWEGTEDTVLKRKTTLQSDLRTGNIWLPHVQASH